MTPEVCPNCGADVPPTARSCPACGADEHTGWAEDAQIGGLDIPEETFDYSAYVKREFGAPSPVPAGIHWFWWVVALVLVALFLAFWMH